MAGAGPHVILIVDDEPAILRLVRSILEGPGYIVREAPSGEEALAILQEEATPPRLLLTDIVMKGITGLGLAARVHRILPDLPVIFMTGFANQYEDELSGSVCLRKPFTASQLLAAVDDVLTAPRREAGC